jgi:hypothetical protein
MSTALLNLPVTFAHARMVNLNSRPGIIRITHWMQVVELCSNSHDAVPAISWQQYKPKKV